MKKEKLIANLCCVAACFVEWAAVITILVVLRMNFNVIAVVVLGMLWLGTCRLIKRAVHKHYRRTPEAQEAARLGMSVEHYRKVKKADAKVMSIYKQHGTNNPTADKEVDKILASLPSIEEWRRYENYKMQESVGNMQSMTESLFSGKFDQDYKK